MSMSEKPKGSSSGNAPRETPEERAARIEREAAAFAEAGVDKLKLAQNVKPFTRYKVVELVLCALAVVLGLLYLYTDPKLVPLSVLLPVYTAVFCAIVPLRWKDMKTTGVTGKFAVLTVAVWTALALVVAAATAIYFVRS